MGEAGWNIITHLFNEADTSCTLDQLRQLLATQGLRIIGKEEHRAEDTYRAEIAPKLRSRAEVDTEIVRITREHCRRRPPDEKLPSEAIWKERCFKLIELVREPTAPEPATEGNDICCPYTSGHERDCPKEPKAPGHEPAPEPESHACNHPEPCGCEEAEELKEKLASAEAEMRRLGYGVEPIYVFTDDDAPPKFTSLVGDACWDTTMNRRRTFDWIRKAKNQ